MKRQLSRIFAVALIAFSSACASLGGTHVSDLQRRPGRYENRTVTVDGDRATGESYTIAHHVFSEDGGRKIMVASLRYLDTFTKIDGGWYFAERDLIVDWSETRSLNTPIPV